MSKEVRCFNRLLVIGPGDVLARFVDSSWEKTLQAHYTEWLENLRTRVACQFETIGTPPLTELTHLSGRWPGWCSCSTTKLIRSEPGDSPRPKQAS